MGRAALDEEAIRRIEELNPGMEFDWPRILKGQGAPATEPRPPVEARRQRPENRRPQPRTQHAPPAPRPAPLPPVVESPPPRRDLPSESESVGLGDSRESPPAEGAAIADELPTPAHARIGAAGVRQLRARYAELVARIAERTDETRRAELKDQADRLNPDSWVTDEQVSQGLEQYESILASLREVAGQARRRRRRGQGPRPAGTESLPDGAATPDES